MSGIAVEPVDTDRECGCGTTATAAVVDHATGWMFGLWCRHCAQDIAWQARLQAHRRDLDT